MTNEIENFQNFPPSGCEIYRQISNSLNLSRTWNCWHEKKPTSRLLSNIQPSTNKFASTISLVRMSVSTDPFRSKCGKMMQTAPCCWCVECFSKQEKRRKSLSAPLSEIYHFSLPFFFHRINISLPGLPPLPKSLRVVDPILNQHDTTFTSLIGKGANSTLDTQLATLKREMVSFTRTWKKALPYHTRHYFSIRNWNLRVRSRRDVWKLISETCVWRADRQFLAVFAWLFAWSLTNIRV